MPETRNLLAAELAFGLLDGSDRFEAELLRSTDTYFAVEVAKWEAVAETWLGEIADHPPPPQLWDKITALIGPSDEVTSSAGGNPAASTRESSLWRPLAIAASLMACLFAGLWVSRMGVSQPPPALGSAPSPVGRFSVAQIGSTGEPRLATVLYDRNAGTLTIRIAAIASDPAKAPEVWLINGTNPPHSLGFGQVGEATRMQASARLRGSLVGGATLAITLEPVSDQPHAAPSSKILGTGTITTL